MPAIGANDGGLGIDAALFLEGRDVLIGEAENAQFVARRLHRRLRRAHVVFGLDQGCLALLVILQRNGLALEQVLGARSLQLRQIERGLRLVHGGHRGDEIVLRLNVVGGLDHEQRLALDDAVARLGQQLGDPSRIGREHRRRAILVDRDLALGDLFGAEAAFGDGLNGQARPFGGARRVALRSLAGLARDFRMSRLGAAELGKSVEARADCTRHQRQGHSPAFPAKLLPLLGNFIEHTSPDHSATFCLTYPLIVPNWPFRQPKKRKWTWRRG